MKFELIDLDKLKEEDLKNENGFILNTTIDYLKLHESKVTLKNSVYSRRFGINESDPKEVITYLYTCDCEQLTGQINENKLCERCETKVTKNEFPITTRAWGVLKPYKILSYGGMIHLKVLLGRKNFKKFLRGSLKKLNIIKLYNDWDNFLDHYGKNDKEETEEFLKKHKEKVFTSYVPVISKKTRPMLRSNNIIPHYTMLDDINSIYTGISGDIQTLKEYCDGDKTPKITKATLHSIQRKFFSLGELLEEKVGGGKEKMLRNQIYATRLPFTARAVIVPLITDRFDVCTVPYDVFRGLYRREILDILISKGEPIHKAYKFIDLNRMLTKSDKDLLDEILKKEIENPYVLVNRQPTLKFQSTKSLEIIRLFDEDVLRVPSVLLEGWNGDHSKRVA